ncbi:MAG: hypothetical protein RLZZ366_793 [Pseudomonadota bacterium]|jgi:iron complex outermembrane recepter protein
MGIGARTFRTALLVGTIGFSATVAVAQTAALPNDTAEDGGEIIVTAQKSEQRLKDVPSSVAVLGGDALRTQSADRLEDYAARVPGLVLNARGSGQQAVTIRGLSTGTQGASTVAVYIDDAPVGASNQDGGGGLLTPDIDSIDLTRVEVLRGPQGTLYGASNIGGLLKYVTVAPNTNRTEGALALDGGTIAHGEEGFAARGRINLPISADKAALLVSGYYRRDPGFVDDAGRSKTNLDRNERLGGRIALRLTPSDQLSVTLAAIAQNSEADGFTQVDLNPATLAPIYGLLQQRRAFGSEYYQNKVRTYYGTLTYDMDWAKLTSTTSFNTVSNRSAADFTLAFFDPASPNVGYAAANKINQNKFTQELRLSGDIGGSVKWLVGGFYTREKSRTLVSLPTFDAVTGVSIAGPSLLDSDIQGKYREIAGFAQADIRFSPAFNITVGGRYANNRQRNVTTSSGALVGPASTTTLTASDNVATFTVSPQFKLSNEITLYGRVASGYRPGGANGAFAPNITYGPDRVTNFEAGLKGSFPASRLTFEVAGFYINWTDIQLPLLTPLGLSYTDNVGRASSSGFEANLSYAPVSGLTFGGSSAYTVAELKRDIPSGSFGVKGDALPYSPRWKSSATVDYKTGIGTGWEGFVGSSLFYTGSTRAEFQSDPAIPRIRLPAFVTVDGRIGVQREKLMISLIGKNIFDKQAYNGVRSITFDPTGPAAFSLIQARTILLSLKYDY